MVVYANSTTYHGGPAHGLDLQLFSLIFIPLDERVNLTLVQLRKGSFVGGKKKKKASLNTRIIHAYVLAFLSKQKATNLVGPSPYQGESIQLKP